MAKILYWDDPEPIQVIVRKLRSDHVIGGSSDTVLGLLAPCTEKGFFALNNIKGREKKPYVVLISSRTALKNYYNQKISLQIEKLIESCWPGPLTLIFKTRDDLPWFLRTHESIALRVPRHAGLLQLLAHFDGLFSTSANYSGQPVPVRVSELDPRIVQQLPYLIIERDRTEYDITPSTILDCSSERITVVREGAFSIADLERIAGTTFAKKVQ